MKNEPFKKDKDKWTDRDLIYVFTDWQTFGSSSLVDRIRHSPSRWHFPHTY